jgi:hypothetical protein
LLQFAIEHGPVEIVDLPTKNGDFPQLCWFTRGYTVNNGIHHLLVQDFFHQQYYVKNGLDL